MKKIKLKIECQSCGGSGIYSGIGERDGAAVICYTCKGTGCEDYYFEYNDFIERKKKKGVKRVYLNSYGYCIAPKPLELEKADGTKQLVDFSKEGVSYKEFCEGKKPKHIETMACPMMADQSACHDIKYFTDYCNELNDGWVSYIPECKNQCNKAECWTRFNEGSK